MAIFRDRIKSRGELLTLFVACSFPIFVYTIPHTLVYVSQWVLRLTMWETLSVISYVLAAAVIESILIFLVALLLVMIVPKRFYDGILIPLAAAFSTLTTLLVVYLNLTQERSILRDNFTGTLLGLAVYLLLMGLTYIVLRRNQRITAILTGLIDRLMPLALLYALFAVIGLVVVITRNVIA
ncbi:MAG: hypothetical protein KA170_03130 [Candidatus Promineofilum sp.]|nr:hypothetical protein [Promineifilum sp.]